MLGLPMLNAIDYKLIQAFVLFLTSDARGNSIELLFMVVISLIVSKSLWARLRKLGVLYKRNKTGT